MIRSLHSAASGMEAQQTPERGGPKPPRPAGGARRDPTPLAAAPARPMGLLERSHA